MKEEQLPEGTQLPLFSEDAFLQEEVADKEEK